MALLIDGQVADDQIIIESKVRETFLPFALPDVGDEEIAEVVASLKSGWITTGPKVKQFETDLARYVGASHAVAVNSCTAGLHLSLIAAGVGPDDEVILSTVTFCSAANVIVHMGAKPILIDIGPDFNIQPETIRNAITSRTKAIMPVHFASQPCDLDEIYQIAHEHDLAVIEDAAHAIGSAYHGMMIGSDTLQKAYPNLRRTTVFSFYATKNMTTGEGGMVTTNSESIAAEIRLLALHGMSKDAWKRYTSAGSWYYEVVAPGYKYNMTDTQAALGIHQLQRLDRFSETRQHQAQLYNEAFSKMPEIETPLLHSDRSHIYHLYVLRLNLEQLTIDRAEFIELLKEKNIGASVHFIPVHTHPYYCETYGYQTGDLPVAESIYERIVSIPLYPKMTDEDVKDVISAIREVLTMHRSTIALRHPQGSVA